MKSISKQLQKAAGKLILVSAGNMEISKISKSVKGMIGRPKKNETLIVHCVVNTNAVRNEEITLNEKEHDWQFKFASKELNFDAEKNDVQLQKTE